MERFQLTSTCDLARLSGCSLWDLDFDVNIVVSVAVAVESRDASAAEPDSVV